MKRSVFLRVDILLTVILEPLLLVNGDIANIKTQKTIAF